MSGCLPLDWWIYIEILKWTCTKQWRCSYLLRHEGQILDNFKKFKVIKIVLDSMLHETLKWPQIAPFCISSKQNPRPPPPKNYGVHTIKPQLRPCKIACLNCTFTSFIVYLFIQSSLQLAVISILWYSLQIFFVLKGSVRVYIID